MAGRSRNWLKKAKQPSCTASSQPYTPREPIEQEVARYEKTRQPDSDSNSLEWWKVDYKTFPMLAKVAKKYKHVS